MIKYLKGEIYVQAPTLFIQRNYHYLLPDWQYFPSTIIIIILFSQDLIDPKPYLVEQEKQRLKKEFLDLGHYLQEKAFAKNHLFEIIDPQDGYPINSQQGQLSFDIVTIIHQLLEFKISQKNGCKILHHPTQGTAIYPSLLLSNANLPEIKSLLQNISCQNYLIRRHLKVIN